MSKVQHLIAEVELVRIALGRPVIAKPNIIVGQVDLLSVTFAEQLTLTKIDRLYGEVTGVLQVPNKNLPVTLTIKKMQALLNKATEKILHIKKILHINKQPKPFEQLNSVDLAQVLNAMLLLNREINNLLYSQVAPSDVFERITLAMSVMVKVMREFGLSDRIPLTPKFIADKTPQEVYLYIMQCIKQLQSISRRSDVKLMAIVLRKQNNLKILPSDAYDLSGLMNDMIEMYSRKKFHKNYTAISYYPGYKMPSQVYQRVGVLLLQMKKLNKYLEKNKNEPVKK